MKKLTLLALSLLLQSGMAPAQTPVQNPIAPAISTQPAQSMERHPQAGCLGGIRRELGDYAGAVDQGLKTGRIDPNKRAALEKILAELTALEAVARADKALTGEACKGLYKRVVAENSGIQVTMRARPYSPANAPAAAAAGGGK